MPDFDRSSRSAKIPAMDDSDFVDVPLQVRYSETDQMGRAYYGEYFVWFEVARTTYCKARGFSYADLERETQTFLPVVEANCRYLRPLAYDDEFVVRTRVVRAAQSEHDFLVRGVGEGGGKDRRRVHPTHFYGTGRSPQETARLLPPVLPGRYNSFRRRA